MKKEKSKTFDEDDERLEQKQSGKQLNWISGDLQQFVRIVDYPYISNQIPRSCWRSSAVVSRPRRRRDRIPLTDARDHTQRAETNEKKKKRKCPSPSNMELARWRVFSPAFSWWTRRPYFLLFFLSGLFSAVEMTISPSTHSLPSLDLFTRERAGASFSSGSLVNRITYLFLFPTTCRPAPVFHHPNQKEFHHLFLLILTIRLCLTSFNEFVFFPINISSIDR